MSHYHCVITDARCQVRLGIHEFERHAPQDILVSVKLFFPFRSVGHIRHIGDTVDYEPLRNFIHSWGERPHVPLIEGLLDELVTVSFSDPRVDRVKASIRKTAIFEEIEEIGVGLDTTRSEWDILCQRRD
ncbi:MAG: dihydroneopterin aldolase [Ferrovum sp.]|nr:dihydroneopterin aldolase [Ferrovum sp.]NDU88197.1 dihydroneopterin aldolase [Ferrovum sp.]